MYINLFARRWCSPDLIDFLHNLPIEFKVRMITHQNEMVNECRLNYRERWVKCVIVEFMDTGRCWTYPIDGPMTESQGKNCIDVLTTWINGIKFKTKQPEKINDLQESAARETEKALGIDNNIDRLPRAVTFHLNDYHQDERNKMLAYLATVDSSSVDVVINLDFSRCSKEQLESNADFLMMSSASVK